ncbi:pyroglutamylated RF-amide peptide receptor [Hydra vulgaris]|uniref:pyroglutamylated RF-amide peptide receptor n=1 Tax=Hydra vulgaris TaxID=6087 RepID=UPI001F5F7EE8|nr:pyroglutamylated RF-amide peptide receptor-like [Hydra vulgaris]XP_047146652.1 pyroglutamylated RF-amide peptide receptor-like [Hydra vulgaris]
MQNVSFESFELSNFTNTSWVNKYRDVFSYEEKLVACIGYTTVTVIGIISNSLVSYLIISNSKLRNIVNLLILNLAISDIIACLSIFPFIYIDLAETRIRGATANLLCGFTAGLSGFFAAAIESFITLSVFSITRYLIINHPLKLSWRLELKNMKWVFGLTWTLSFVIVIPNLISYKYDENFKICIRNWARGVDPLVYFTFIIVIGLFLPLTSLLFTYFTSLYTLYIKGQLRENTLNKNSAVSERNFGTKKKALKWLGFLVLVYLICWLPFATYLFFSVVMGKYSKNYDDVRKGVRLFRLTIFFAAFNTVLNPLIYAYKSKQLRSAFKLLFKLRVRAELTSTLKSTFYDQLEIIEQNALI